MKNLGELYKATSVVFGLLPGITILITNLGVPPETSKLLFAGTIEAIGVLTLLILWTNKEKIRAIPNPKVTQIVIASAGMFLIALFLYLFLFGRYVVQVPHSDPLLFPMWPQGELIEGLNNYGSKYELIQNWGRDDVYRVIQSSSSVALQLTSLVFLFIFLIVFVSLTLAFGVLGIKNTDNHFS